MRTFDEIMACDIESKLQAMSGLTELIKSRGAEDVEDVKWLITLYTDVLKNQLKGYKGGNNE